MSLPVEVLKALGDETRLRLLNLFLQTHEDLCVCEMVDTLQLPQYHISRHLSTLKTVGLVKPQRHGTWVYYRLVRAPSPFLRDLFGVLRLHLGQAYAADLARLRQRLGLRQEGRCVVGFVSAVELEKLLRDKNLSTT